ncbi:MAG: carboxypeptidase-like regulatory domain-containing protein [Actinomycetota bacterium]|nr:carboxypeptidase-like regulatory domain-containing protein [Actinomycetota bacterium]
MFRASVMRGVNATVVVLAALAVAAGTARADTTGTVAGQVVDTNGVPLAGICVGADSAASPSSGYGGAKTDSNGDYAFPIPPAAYLISFQGCGQNYVSQFYPAQPSYKTAGQVTVVAGQTTGGIDARMVAGGVITGKVVDGITGAAPPQGAVDVEIQTPVASATGPQLGTQFASNPVAPDGTYIVSGLPPGTYLVYFNVTGTSNGVIGPYVSEWYPNAPDPGHAAMVSVQSGQTASLGVELAEVPGTVTGRVTDSAGAPIAGYDISAGITEPDGSMFHGPFPIFTTTASDGTFTLMRLAPGTWTISALPTGGTNAYPETAHAIVQAAATTPNINFTFCLGSQCPPTHLLALSTSIRSHQLLFAGQISDPSYAVIAVGLRGHIGRRKVNIRNPNYFVQGGSFSYSMPLPRRDRALRAGVLVIDFGPSEAARGGRFVVKVPSVYPGPPSTPTRPHKHKRRRKHGTRPHKARAMIRGLSIPVSFGNMIERDRQPSTPR